MNTFRLRLVLLTAIVLLLTACGAAGGGGSDPAGTVKAAFDATQSGGLAKLDDFACAAQKGKMAEAFGGVSQLSSAGVDLNSLMNAVSIKFDNVTTKESSRTDKEATIHVTGNMTTTVDPEKFKPILKQMLAANGQPADDATVQTVLAAMSSQLSNTQALDEDVKVVNEGGKWLICQ
jgi:hypothetical protein